MAPELFKVSVPGSMMLLGEHAVLAGKKAVVCAVNKRLHMQLTPVQSSLITITDTRLGTMTQELTQLQIHDPFKFVLSAILAFQDQIPSGFTLDINAEFSSVVGLGSSAAVTVATVAVLSKWLHPIPLSEEQVFKLSRKIMLEVQGVGSGADIAASVYGGVVGYTMDASAIDKLPIIPNLTAIYCGYKTPTVDVINKVAAAQQNRPRHYANLYAAMHACVLQAIAAIKQADWPLLGALFAQHHALQAALGTSDNLLDELIEFLSAQPQIYGAKISGSGLGDCVIGLGELDNNIVPTNPDVLQFIVNIDPQGYAYASN